MAKQSTDNRECLGEVRCLECSGTEYVYRSKRRGAHLYGRCPSCGINQRTGQAAQARLAKYVPVGTLAPASPTTVTEATTTAGRTSDAAGSLNATTTDAPSGPSTGPSATGADRSRASPAPTSSGSLPHPVLSDPQDAPAVAAMAPSSSTPAPAPSPVPAPAPAPAATGKGVSFFGLVFGLMVIICPALVLANR